MIQTPSNLELLLHCHYSAEPHPRFEAPAIQEGLKYLRENGMIRISDYDPDRRADVYNTTEKGIAYIDYLMTVPFPEEHWIVPTN